MRVPINSFNGGEVSPLLEGRLDLPSLARSNRRLRNVMPLSTGAAVRRPPLLHVAVSDTLAQDPPTLGDPSVHSRLIPFIYDTATRYDIQLSATWIKIWRTDGTLAQSMAFTITGTPQYFPALGAFNVDEISYAQVNNVLWLAHTGFPPVQLTRVTDTNWTLASTATDFRDAFWPAFLDENVTSNDPADKVEGLNVSTTPPSYPYSQVLGGMVASANVGDVISAPCPATWRLYTTTTGSFTGTVKIEGANTWNAATWTTISTTTFSASTQARTLKQDWWHQYLYLRITFARTSGSGTVKGELVHVGSKSAPTMWYINSSDTTRLFTVSPAPAANYAIGECIQVGNLRRDNLDDLVLTVATAVSKASAGLYVFGNWEAYSTGIWEGAVYLESQDATGRWDVIRTWSGNKDYNFTSSGSHVPGSRLRLRAEIVSAAQASGTSVWPRFSLKSSDGMLYQWARVSSAPVDRGDGSASFQARLMNGADGDALCAATTAVSRGAFSPSQGYPAAVCIHEQRVYFAGTAQRPTTIWGSAVNDLLNFRRTGFDDGSFMFELASNEGNPLQWMLSASRGILAGSSGDEWLIDGGDTGITPTNITARRQSRIGSSPIQAIPAAGVTLFVQRGSMHLQEYQFAWESQQFKAVDLSELVKHLTSSGIRAIAYSQNPEPVLWCVMNDGSLLTCAYNRAQEVIAWAKQTTQGSFESVSVKYGDTANADDVRFIVLRNGRRRIEKLDVSFWASLYNDGPLYHADAAVVKTGAAFTSVTGLAHLNGLTVGILANGVPQADAVVSGGAVTVPAGTTHAVVGLPFDSEWQPMPFDLMLATGTIQGRKTQEPMVAARLWRSKAGRYADSASSTLYDMKITGELTGILRMAMQAKFRDSNEVYFKSTGMLPLNIVAVVPSVNAYGE